MFTMGIIYIIKRLFFSHEKWRVHSVMSMTDKLASDRKGHMAMRLIAKLWSQIPWAGILALLPSSETRGNVFNYASVSLSANWSK